MFAMYVPGVSPAGLGVTNTDVPVIPLEGATVNHPVGVVPDGSVIDEYVTAVVKVCAEAPPLRLTCTLLAVGEVPPVMKLNVRLEGCGCTWVAPPVSLMVSVTGIGRGAPPSTGVRTIDPVYVCAARPVVETLTLSIPGTAPVPVPRVVDNQVPPLVVEAAAVKCIVAALPVTLTVCACGFAPPF